MQAAIASVDTDASIITQRDLAFEKASLEDKKKAILEKAKKAAWLGQAESFARSAISTIRSFKDPTVLGSTCSTRRLRRSTKPANNIILDNWRRSRRSTTALRDRRRHQEREGRRSCRVGSLRFKEKLAAARLRRFQAAIDQKLASLEGWDAHRPARRTRALVQKYGRLRCAVAVQLRDPPSGRSDPRPRLRIPVGPRAGSRSRRRRRWSRSTGTSRTCRGSTTRRSWRRPA